MKNLTLFFLLLFTSSYAQDYEFGYFFGGSRYFGDVGTSSNIIPNKPAFGILFKDNIDTKFTIRASYTAAYIYANDRDSKNISKVNRNYNFISSLRELNLGVEFNIFEFDQQDVYTEIIPYIHTGILYGRYGENIVFRNDLIRTGNFINYFGIPLTIGAKADLLPHLNVGFEIGAKYTFTDDLDGSKPKNNSLNRFGNLKNNDIYIFTGITIMYSFRGFL